MFLWMLKNLWIREWMSVNQVLTYIMIEIVIVDLPLLVGFCFFLSVWLENIK